MEAISSTDNSQQLQQTTSDSSKKTEETSANFDGAKFESYLKSSLNSANPVSEEALFASLLEERVADLKGVDSGFSSMMSSAKSALVRSDGFIPLEDAAKNALREFRAAGKITAEEADKVYSEAFAAAQLDSNADVLFDDRGGPGDSSIAVSDFASALIGCKSKLEQIEAGTLVVASRSLDEVTVGKSGISRISSVSGSISSGSGEIKTPNGTTFDGANGFLFKPISNNQQKLAILLPEDYKGNVSGVTLLDSLGNVLDEGTSTGYGEEGTREKFSFNKKGGEYPENLTVNVQFMDGTNIQYLIPDPAKRYD